MKKEWTLLLVIAFIIVIIVIFDWNKPPSPKPQTSSSEEEANVTVLIEYLKDKSDSKTMTFAVSLDTHSVELDYFDFEKDIFIEAGDKSSNPVKITTSGSGHHRSGEIVFPNIPPPFTLVLKNIANINRREFLFEKLQ